MSSLAAADQVGRERLRTLVYRPVNPHERARVEGWYSAHPPLIFRNRNARKEPWR